MKVVGVLSFETEGFITRFFYTAVKYYSVLHFFCLRAVHVLSQIQEMRKGVMVENRIISIADQVCMEPFKRCSKIIFH